MTDADSTLQPVPDTLLAPRPDAQDRLGGLSAPDPRCAARDLPPRAWATSTGAERYAAPEADSGAVTRPVMSRLPSLKPSYTAMP